MTTCIGIHNEHGYLLAADTQLSSGTNINLEPQNKLINLTPYVNVAFGGTQFLFAHLEVFLQNLPTSDDLVSKTSFSSMGMDVVERVEQCVESFLGEGEENLRGYCLDVKESCLAIRAIWEYFIGWLDNAGVYQLADTSRDTITYEAELLFATPIGIFAVGIDGYVSHGHVKVIGSSLARGVCLGFLHGQDRIHSDMDITLKRIVTISGLKDAVHSIFSIVSKSETTTSNTYECVGYTEEDTRD